MAARTHDSAGAGREERQRQPYVLDPRWNVWVRAEGAVEAGGSAHVEADRIGAIVRHAKDLACGSEELQAAARDWFTSYHLGPERANLLRPIRHLLGGRVLEVGAECGAITRFLGETGSEVVALEPVLRQATVASARCAGLPNVAVYCDSLANAELTGRFTCVTLIGALDGVEALERCGSLVADDGILLIAASNKLGLRHFAGAPDDSTGRIFGGISGSSNEGRGFGRHQLAQKLQKAGFRYTEFLYPLPDFRFPRLLLRPDAFLAEEALVKDLLQRFSAYYDPRWNYERLFSERLAWETILDNSLGEDLAPAFLVVASRTARSLTPPGTLAYTYSTARRRCFQKENVLARQNGGLSFLRRKLFEGTAQPSGPSRQQIQDEPYLRGRLWANELSNLLDRPGWTQQSVVNWFLPYRDFLLRHSANIDGQHVLPPDFLDCTPFNVVRRPDGTFEAFDLEWISEGKLALDFVVFRGLLYTLNGTVTVARPQGNPELGVLNLTLQLMAQAGLPVSGERLEQLFALEDEQQKCAAGDHATLDREYWRNVRLSPRIEDVRDELTKRDSAMRELQIRLNEEVNQRDARLAELHREVGRAEQRKAAAEEQVEDLRREARSLSQALSEMTDARARERSQVERLEETLRLRESELRELAERIVALQSEVETLVADARDQRAELDRLKAKLRVGERRRNEIARELAAERSRSARFEGIAGDLRGIVAGHSRNVVRQQSELHQARVAIVEKDTAAAALERVGARLQHDLEALEGSWSWAVTRPFRRAVAFTGAILRWSKRPFLRARLAWLCRSSEVRRAKGLIVQSGLFDPQYYASHYPEAAALGVPLLAHYLVWGAAEARNPNALFDARFYRASHPKGGRSGNDLLDWIEHGSAAVRQAHPLFDLQFYLRQNPDLGSSAMHPLAHFLRTGGREGRDPHPLFDSSFYLERYPEVARSGMNPLLHYLMHGHHEGRAPHRIFDGRYYCEQNAGVARSSLDPLTHYVLAGWRERFAPHLLFDAGYYLDLYPEVAAADINPLVHYLERGAGQGRCPHPVFDAAFYRAQVPAGVPSESDALLHYLEAGGTKGLRPHPLFDSAFYRAQRPDLDVTQTTLLEHYLSHGWKEGCDPHPLFQSTYYVEQNTDVASSGVNPLLHYLKSGSSEGRRPNPCFDPAWYARRYPDVGKSGLEPLEHYVVHGAREGRNPGPLFDTAWYVAANPDVARAKVNPLAHYLRHGMQEGRAALPPVSTAPPSGLPGMPEAPVELSAEIESILPYFDVDYYRVQCPELREGYANPYEHYLSRGAKEGLNPHPLFDTSFYLDNNPDVARDGLNPLLHFALFGGREARDPHPLFDCAYYLEKNADVKRSERNTLQHYLDRGWTEGRNPNRMFDGAFYLRSNPDVRTNPLIHFILHGAAEGRNPHPAFDVRYYVSQHPALSESGQNPLAHYLGPRKPRQFHVPVAPAAAKTRTADRFRVEALDDAGIRPQPFRPARTVLCVTHVPPFPPRAGNEYLIYRQLDYLEGHGYRIVLALSPLPGEELSPDRFRVLCGRFPYAILCGRDGSLQHRLSEGQAVLNALDGVRCEPLSHEPGEAADPRGRWLAGTERDFCHDFLARLALHLEAALAPCVVLSEYVFQTRFLPFIDGHSLKVIQTHDMFSTKQHKVIQFGVEDELHLSSAQERRLLLRADLILACQNEEAREFAALVPERTVLEVGLDFDVVAKAGPPHGSKILYVGSDNRANTKGLRDFLRIAWPLILRQAPAAELLVAGRICRTIERAPENVKLLGLVDNLELLYEQARLTINPSVAGTGFKIKTAESLSRFRPAVGWPSGIDGFRPELAALCHTARDWHDFASLVVAILKSPAAEWFSDEQKAQIRRLLAAETIYAEVLKHLDAYSDEHALPRWSAAAGAAEGAGP